jgi:hypothetical protein
MKGNEHVSFPKVEEEILCEGGHYVNKYGVLCSFKV